jgi:hypothetical protein
MTRRKPSATTVGGFLLGKGTALFDQRHLSLVLMDIVAQNGCHRDLIRIDALLHYLTGVALGPVPALIDTVGGEHLLAPSVEDEHLEFADTLAIRPELIVHTIAIGRERIRDIEGEHGPDDDVLGEAVLAAEAVTELVKENFDEK